MNIFDVRDEIVENYQKYVRSFLRIEDERIREFVDGRLLEENSLWPDALIQLNPAYETGATVEELSSQGTLHDECGEIFRKADGSPIRLYRHQEEAIQAALRSQNYVVTSGTGSGKTLTYFIPIFDSVLRSEQSQGEKVHAIIVYPMNALMNSQFQDLETRAKLYEERTGREFPVRFRKYTGQEDQDQKLEIQQLEPNYS